MDVTESLKIEGRNLNASSLGNTRGNLLLTAAYVIERLQEQLAQEKEGREADLAVAEQGYAEAWDLVRHLQQRVEEVRAEERAIWEQALREIHKDRAEVESRLYEVTHETGHSRQQILLGQGIDSESGLFVPPQVQ
jgi:hypothetical protein